MNKKILLVIVSAIVLVSLFGVGAIGLAQEDGPFGLGKLFQQDRSGKVIAEVNGEKINQVQLDRSKRMAEFQQSNQGTSGKKEPISEEKLLEQMIDYALVEQECRRLKISTTYETALAETREDFATIQKTAEGTGTEAASAKQTVAFFEEFAKGMDLTVDEYFQQYAADARRKSMDAIALKEWIDANAPQKSFEQYLSDLRDQANIQYYN